MACIYAVVTENKANKSSMPTFDGKGEFVGMKDTVVHSITFSPKMENEEKEKKAGKDNAKEEKEENIFASYPDMTFEIRGVTPEVAALYEVNEECTIEINKGGDKD